MRHCHYGRVVVRLVLYGRGRGMVGRHGGRWCIFGCSITIAVASSASHTILLWLPQNLSCFLQRGLQPLPLRRRSFHLSQQENPKIGSIVFQHSIRHGPHSRYGQSQQSYDGLWWPADFGKHECVGQAIDLITVGHMGIFPQHRFVRRITDDGPPFLRIGTAEPNGAAPINYVVNTAVVVVLGGSQSS